MLPSGGMVKAKLLPGAAVLLSLIHIFAAMQADNGKRLDEMRHTVDEKLQKTLDEKLQQSFSRVSEQLESVYTVSYTHLAQWGWLFTSLGAPCVAQRVCPMPQCLSLIHI